MTRLHVHRVRLERSRVIACLLIALAMVGCGVFFSAQPEAPPRVVVRQRVRGDGRAVRVLRCVRRLPGTDEVGEPEPAAREHVDAPRKQAWEARHGGQVAARPVIRRRLAGWPEHLVSSYAPSPSDDEFLRKIATDTWRGMAAFTDRENGLPVDNVRFEPGPSHGAPEGLVGDYTSGTNIGLYLASIVAARDLELISAAEARDRIAKVLGTLGAVETYRGFVYNFYDTTSLERTSNFISFIDAAWLLAGLIVVRSSVPELAGDATRLIDAQNFGLFYDPRKDLIHHGYWVQRRAPSIFHYGVFYSEARLGALLAIGKGDIPASTWRSMLRVPPPMCARPGPLVSGFLLTKPHDRRAPTGYYEWENFRYVPSWGGSMFEALMPTLLLDEGTLSPNGLARNDRAHVQVQRYYALRELGYPVWGMSPSARVDGGGYGEFGAPVLGARGYVDGIVTPHASALALTVARDDAVANLRELVEHFPVYGDFGFYDGVDPMTGRVAHVYLSLDQAMTFLAIANELAGGRLRERFASDPLVAAALELLRTEEVPFD